MPWRFNRSTVAAAAHRSDGLGRIGTITRSASWNSSVISSVRLGAVSMKQYGGASSVEKCQAIRDAMEGEFHTLRRVDLALVMPRSSACLGGRYPGERPAHYRPFSLNRQVRAQRGLAAATLLGVEHDGLHAGHHSCKPSCMQD